MHAKPIAVNIVAAYRFFEFHQCVNEAGFAAGMEAASHIVRCVEMHGGRGRPEKPLGRRCSLPTPRNVDTADSPAPAEEAHHGEEK